MKDFAERSRQALDLHYESAAIVRGITKEFLEEVELKTSIVSLSQLEAVLIFRPKLLGGRPGEYVHRETFDIAAVSGESSTVDCVQKFLYNAVRIWISRCGLLDPWAATVKEHDMNGRASVLLSQSIQDSVTEILLRRSSRKSLGKFIKIAYEHIAQEVHSG